MKNVGMVLAASLIAMPVTAHESTGPNGGRVVDAGNYHVELVGKGQKIDVYVTDADDKPVVVDNFKGAAILIVNGKPLRIAIAPVGANKLSGNAQIEMPKDPKGAIQIQTPIGTSLQGKFQ